MSNKNFMSYSDAETVLTEFANNIKAMGNTDSYSTDEVRTNKVWINGKPIYRKVYSASPFTPISQQWSNTGVIIYNVDQLISVTPLYVSNVSPYNKGVVHNGIYRVNENNYLQYYFTGSYQAEMKIGRSIIIEYTKTTD